ncbi:MAG: methyl-accepting chemotaxis protein [Lachnospiraceae bacterium]|nr:methyl-accepting chemotaxis protein [Lachnospiraceae bacterium]
MEENNIKGLRSIKTRLIFMVVAMLMVSIIVLTVISAVNTVKQGVGNANEVNEAQAAIVEERVSAIIEMNLEALNVFAYSPSTIAYLDGTGKTDANATSIVEQLKKIDENMADGNSTALSGADGMQVLRSVGDCVDVSDRQYYKDAMEGKEAISDMVVSKTTGKCISTIAVPVYDASHSKVIGMVQRNYDLSVLHELLASEVTQKKQEIVMVDTTGTVVAHSARENNPDDPESQAENPFYTDSRGDKTEGNYVAPFMGDTWIISWVKIPKCEWIVASCRVQEVALASVYKTVAFQVIIGVIFIIAGIVVMVIYSKSITDPLKEIETSLTYLSAGAFKEIPAYTNRTDELGHIIKSTNNVIGTLRDIVANIKNGADAVSDASDNLADMSERISVTATDVATAVNEIAGGATQQAEEINNATANIMDIERAVGSVQNSTVDLTAITDRMQVASKESAKSLSELKSSSENMNRAINSISEKISATSQAVGSINDKVAAITDIAAQTNLLALNASIEAARAGDAGRGFAVVAEEIGKLAADSSQSADMIRAEMEVLLQQSKSAVTMAEDVQKTNEEQQKVIGETFASVNTMIEDIGDSVESVNSIAKNADACAGAKDVVVDVMSSLSSISEENAAGSEETGASMDELSNTVASLASSADSLREVSADLTEGISFFKM